MAVCASAYADHLRRKDVLSTTQIRKIFTTFATMVPGFLMIVQCFYGKLKLIVKKQLKPQNRQHFNAINYSVLS